MPHIRPTIRAHRFTLLARCAIAAGTIAVSAAPAMAGCQSGNTANNTTTFLLSNANCQATATGNESTAVGASATATGFWGTSLGLAALAKGLSATSLGARAGSPAAVDGATTVGALTGHGGAGAFSTAVGGGNSVGSGGMSSAAHALGAYSVAIGGGDFDTFDGARANGYRSIAIGQKSVGAADFATVVGFNANAIFASTAIGTDSTASGDSSAAFGRFSTASGNAAVALGKTALASKTGSVAIGSGSIANVANTVSVGTATARRRIVNVANGVGVHDAVTVGQLNAAVAAATAPVAMAPADDNGKSAIEEVRRELSALRALVQSQQQELAELKAARVVAVVE